MRKHLHTGSCKLLHHCVYHSSALCVDWTMADQSRVCTGISSCCVNIYPYAVILKMEGIRENENEGGRKDANHNIGITLVITSSKCI